MNVKKAGTRGGTPAKTRGDRLGAAPHGHRMQKLEDRPLRKPVSGTSSFGSHLKPSPSLPVAPPLSSRLCVADGGSAGAAAGSSAAALELIAALAELPHAQVAARPRNAPIITAACHTAALSCHRHH